MSNLQPTPADLESIAWMCYRLDGLPLFIIIVASHIRAVGSIHALKVRMQQSRFGFAGHITDLPRSQRTMLAPLDWAYEQLTADQQKVFRRLALFPASCSLAALQAICQDVSNTQVALDTLVDKSLVSFLNGPVLNSLRGNSNPQAGLRYTMLQTIREYALIQLKSNGEAPNAAT